MNDTVRDLANSIAFDLVALIAHLPREPFPPLIYVTAMRFCVDSMMAIGTGFGELFRGIGPCVYVWKYVCCS